GVQTCALPVCRSHGKTESPFRMASAEQSCSDGWTRASYFPTATAKLFFSSQILRRRMLRAELVSEKHDHKMESTNSIYFVLTNETFHHIFTFIRCSEV